MFCNLHQSDAPSQLIITLHFSVLSPAYFNDVTHEIFSFNKYSVFVFGLLQTNFGECGGC